jgi:hypothetical protein
MLVSQQNTAIGQNPVLVIQTGNNNDLTFNVNTDFIVQDFATETFHQFKSGHIISKVKTKKGPEGPLFIPLSGG